MTGYVRQDASNNISNGSVIDADDLDLEFNAVEAAFNSSTGHNHDGTSGEGAPILVVGPAQDIVTSSSQMAPKTDDTYDLGSATNKWKDLYVDGVAYVDAINLNGTAITSTATELNLLDGATLTTTELNYVDGVTSPIQTQLAGKMSPATYPDLVAIEGLPSSGFATRIGSNTWAQRTVAGTTDQITVTNGNGVAGNPTISAVIASQAEAEAGTDNTKLMTALRVKQAVTTSSILAATAGASVGAVGTYAFLSDRTNTTIEAGDTRAATNLYYAGVGVGDTAGTASEVVSAGQSGQPSGTWRAMGRAAINGGAGRHNTTLWLRIA